MKHVSKKDTVFPMMTFFDEWGNMKAIFGSTTVPKVLGVVAVILGISYAAEDDGFYESSFKCKPTDSVEFGFVFLPDPAQLDDLEKLAQGVHEKVRTLPPLELNLNDPIRAGYNNVLITLPHVSVGQYGLLGMELDALKSIVDEASKSVSIFQEPMELGLSVTAVNVFLDFKNIFGETNPAITALYKALRASYMGKIKTKRPITQAYLARASEDNPEELLAIQTHFQNWGTPEGNRIRPHFTLSYNYPCERAAAEEALKSFVIPESLKTIKFTHLGIMAIDIWGNPLKNGIIHAVPLNP